VSPDSSDEESGSLVTVATRNVLGCFSISIFGPHWRVVLAKGIFTSFAITPPCRWGGVLLICKGGLLCGSSSDTVTPCRDI